MALEIYDSMTLMGPDKYRTGRGNTRVLQDQTQMAIKDIAYSTGLWYVDSRTRFSSSSMHFVCTPHRLLDPLTCACARAAMATNRCHLAFFPSYLAGIYSLVRYLSGPRRSGRSIFSFLKIAFAIEARRRIWRALPLDERSLSSAHRVTFAF